MELSSKEQSLLREEVHAFWVAATDPAVKERYAALLAAVDAADIPEGQGPLLTHMVEIVLESGRVGEHHGPDGEQTMIRLYQKTPRGKEVAKSVADLNQALQVLQGQVIEEVAFAARGPGRYRLEIGTDRCQVSVGVDRHGLQIEGLDVGI